MTQTFNTARAQSPVAYEATCAKCGETFNPNDEDDIEHIERADGQPCGGEGEALGSWL